MIKTPLLDIRAISKTYQSGTESFTVFDEISFRLDVGERIAIVGKSGSGKTTLLNVISGLEQYTNGDVLYKGQSLSDMSRAEQAAFRSHAIGFVYQFHHLLPECSALENILLPFLIRGQANKAMRERALAMLERVGLQARANSMPSTLSGGERQRVAIARALVTHPVCVFLDEPTGNLDAASAEQVWQLLESICTEYGTACILVTHDADLAARADRCLVLTHATLNETTAQLAQQTG